MKKWVAGNPNFRAEQDGKVCYFPGEKQKQMFQTDPAKYTPALGGDFVVCLANNDQRMAGSVQYSALSGSRLFLFPSESIKQKFCGRSWEISDG